MMTATDDLRRMLDERGVEWKEEGPNKTKWSHHGVEYVAYNAWPRNGGATRLILCANLTPEQVVAEALGRPKVKAHPYGYEPDTGAFDVTRCECGCLNDISATYCNDCGGEIEIDMNAEKEIYHCSRHLVFAEKHDDGSLEFGGKRYIAKDDE